jgi:hypothetical protein
VTYKGVVVYALRSSAYGTSVERHFAVLASQIDIAEVACLTIEKGDAVVLDGAVTPYMDVHVAEA